MEVITQKAHVDFQLSGEDSTSFWNDGECSDHEGSMLKNDKGEKLGLAMDTKGIMYLDLK